MLLGKSAKETKTRIAAFIIQLCSLQQIITYMT
jgi:hypothetical protein